MNTPSSASPRPRIHEENPVFMHRVLNGVKNFASTRWSEISAFVHSKFSAEKENREAANPSPLSSKRVFEQSSSRKDNAIEEESESFTSFEGEESDTSSQEKSEGTAPFPTPLATPAKKENFLELAEIEERLEAYRQQQLAPTRQYYEEKLSLTFDEFIEVYFNLSSTPTDDTAQLLAEQFTFLEGGSRNKVIKAISSIFFEQNHLLSLEELAEKVCQVLINPLFEIPLVQPLVVMTEAILKVQQKQTFYDCEYADPKLQNVAEEFGLDSPY